MSDDAINELAAEQEGDIMGEGEEDFEVGMKQNMMERDAADADQDGKLDFGEFCQFVRDREEGEFTEEELKKRFVRSRRSEPLSRIWRTPPTAAGEVVAHA